MDRYASIQQGIIAEYKGFVYLVHIKTSVLIFGLDRCSAPCRM